MNLINEQYSLLQSSRSVLFHYCETISTQHLLQPVEPFGNRSMRDLFVHVTETYLYWISEFAFHLPTRQVPQLKSMAEIRALYKEVDSNVLEFIRAFDGSWEAQLRGNLGQDNNEITVPAFHLLTHLITHEFHHKGQILTMSRLLGYTPVDTDILRF